MEATPPRKEAQKGSSVTVVQVDPIDELCSVLRECGTSQGLAQIKNLRQENVKLRDQFLGLRLAYRKNLEYLTETQNQLKGEKERNEEERQVEKVKREKIIEAKRAVEANLRTERDALTAANDQMDNLKREVERLSGKLEDKDNEVLKLENMTKENDRLRSELSSKSEALGKCEEALAEAQENLATARSFVGDVTLLQEVKPELCEGLDDMFKVAHKLMSSTFGTDLEEDCLRSPNRWEALRMHHSIRNLIPVPSTNSAAAKRMRVAAALAVYSRALADHVLRPTSLLHSRHVDDALSLLARENPIQEAFFRAVFLNALPMQQKEVRRDGVARAIRDTSAMLTGLVPRDKREAFVEGLEMVTKHVSDGWAVAQSLAEKVQPNFTFDFAEDWKDLPSCDPTWMPTAEAAQSGNGQDTTQREQQQQHHQPTHRGGVRIIWPSFVYTDSTTSTNEELPLQQGYILPRAQMSDAEDELARRAAQRSARQRGASGAGSSGVSPRKRRDSGIFFVQPSGPEDSEKQ